MSATLCSIDKTPLSMAPNPFGGGWVMLCGRGIPCEGHTQAVSCHATNTPDDKAVREVIAKHLSNIQKSWDSFVDMVQAWNASGQEFEPFESVCLIWMRNWCQRIVNEAEDLYIRRRYE